MPLTRSEQSPLTHRIGSEPPKVEGFVTAGEALAAALSKGGRLGILAGALREIAEDTPGVRAVHKRTAMRKRAEQALSELAHSISVGDGL